MKVKSSKALRALMLCGTAASMLSPIVATPLNSILPSNTAVVSASSRVRKPHKKVNKNQLKRNATKFAEQYSKNYRNVVSAADNKANHLSSHNLNKLLVQEKDYVKKNSDKMGSPAVQAHLAVLAKRANKAGRRNIINHWNISIKAIQSRNTKLLQYKHSKNPYIRKYINEISRVNENNIKSEKKNLNKALQNY